MYFLIKDDRKANFNAWKYPIFFFFFETFRGAVAPPPAPPPPVAPPLVYWLNWEFRYPHGLFENRTDKPWEIHQFPDPYVLLCVFECRNWHGTD